MAVAIKCGKHLACLGFGCRGTPLLRRSRLGQGSPAPGRTGRAGCSGCSWC